MHSSEYYDILVDKLRSQAVRNLKVIKSVCDSLEERGLVINLSLLVREIERSGVGPARASIYKNKRFKKYLDLRIAEQELEELEIDGDLDLMERIVNLERENQLLRQFIREMSVN